jgi:hypothetical protein
MRELNPQFKSRRGLNAEMWSGDGNGNPFEIQQH